MSNPQVPTTIERLARWAGQVRVDDLPPMAIEQAKLLVLDTIGCGIAGWGEHAGHAVAAEVIARGGVGPCSIFGSPHRTGLTGAVLANGALVRVLDLNDYIIGEAAKGGDMGGHPSDNIPAAIAAGEVSGRSGLEVLASIVVGYEIYGRVKRAMERNGAWDGITASGLVVPAMIGRLIGLDEVQLAHAMALGLARSPTPAAVRSGRISAAKALTNALIAEQAALATSLAARGVTGPLDLFEEPAGVQALFPLTAALTRLDEPIGADAVILGAHVKAYPCLASGQAIVAAAIEMHARLGGDIARIARGRVVLADYPTIRRQQADPGRIDPQSREAADHSFPFLAAVTLIDGTFGLAQLEDERWNDPAVRALMARLEIGNDPGWAARAPESFPARIEVVTVDGQTDRDRMRVPAGLLARPHRRCRRGREVRGGDGGAHRGRPAAPHRRRRDGARSSPDLAALSACLAAPGGKPWRVSA